VDNYQYNRGHSSNFGDDDETTNRYLRNPYESLKSNKALLEKNHHDFNNQYATTTTSQSSSYKPAPKVNFEFVHKNSTSKEATRRDKENNHLGSSSEASTQTSFVEAAAANGAARSSSASSSVAGSLSSGEIKRQATSNEEQKVNKRSSSKKEKIQQIIQLQKQQHEKRVKALEKLAQLERMHAEKLRQIMLNNSHNDSSITSLIYDSFFQNSHIQNPNGDGNDTTTFDLDQLEREIKEQEYKLLSSDGHSNKNRFMIKNATSNSTCTAAAESKRQSCMNFNEFKSMSHFLSGRKRMDEGEDEDDDDDDDAAAVLPQRRNSEFYMKPSSVSQSEFGQSRRYNNLKNFTHDLPPFNNNNKSETPSSSVEILNLKNTTVLESRKPEGSF
jgi:hypothetical protein